MENEIELKAKYVGKSQVLEAEVLNFTLGFRNLRRLSL
jgi:hypothetical protein